MSRLQWGIISNFATRGWAIVLSIACIPLYIKFMGIEAYGLIGLFTSVTALSNLLDLGLTTTLNREMARYSLRPDLKHEARNLLRTVEIGYWAIGIAIGGSLIALAPWIAHDWVRAQGLSPTTIQRTVMAMGLATALQWPLSLYEGGLLGLQHQPLTNAIRAATSTLRNIGAVLITWLISPTILAFFVWQVLVGALQTGVTAASLWRLLLDTGPGAQFEFRLIARVWRYAAGISAITVAAVVLTQTDKLVLSRLVPLDTFGYYSVASVIAGGLTVLVGPPFEAMFPSFARLVAAGNRTELTTLYHKSCQFVSVLIVPSAAVAMLFSRELLLAWTGNSITAANTALLVTILTAGTALNALAHLPYALQLAHGWTKLTFSITISALLLFVPGIILLVNLYGVIGAASAVVLLNAGTLLVSVHLMNRRLWPGEPWRWHLVDVGYPLAAASVVAVAGRLIIRDIASTPALLTGIAATSLLSILAAALAAPDVRAWVLTTTAALWRHASGHHR